MEHSRELTYLQTAVAASVDLRCYGLSSPRYDNKVSVHFADISNYKQEWDIDELPWDAVVPVPRGEDHPDALDQRVVDAIKARALPPEPDMPPKAHAAAIAFLYLYMMMTSSGDRPSFHFTCRSTLPIGAGLGSSASFSVCIATALLILHGRIELPSVPPPSREPTDNDPGHIHVSHGGRRAIPPDIAEETNRWAFIAEKVLHGNPSGVDNSVAVFGGALAYVRPGFGKRSGMDQIQGFKSLRFLLIDSKVPRDTKALVAGVARKKALEPEVVGKLLNSIQVISDEARRALADPEVPRKMLLRGLSVRPCYRVLADCMLNGSLLQALIDENHVHLAALGVSHPSLEVIRAKTAGAPYRLSTKLTGAGGGGCAVTLVPDGRSTPLKLH